MIWYAYVEMYDTRVETYDTYDTRVYLVEIIWWYDVFSSRLYETYVYSRRDLCGFVYFFMGALDIIAFLC